jgi:NAD(P)H dehydrogenase (quinone)
MTTVLVTSANGDTGRATVQSLLAAGIKVRAFVRSDDERASIMRRKGVDVAIGDMSSLRDIRIAISGVQRAYFCHPLTDGIVEAAAIFAQAAREQNLELIVNMSHKQSRPNARSKTTQDHWLSEQLFNWSGVPSVHLRITFFAEWLLYIAPAIKYGRYPMPFNKDARFAPIAATDIGSIIAGIMADPAAHAGKAHVLHGPVEYSHEELAAVTGRLLGKNLIYEHVTVSAFLEMFGLQDNKPMRKHFEAVAIDQEEGLLEGTDNTGKSIIGRPLVTIEEFIEHHRAKFSLDYENV